MIPQSLKLNIRFLKKLVIWTFEIFAMMHESALLRANDKGKFSVFFFRVRLDPSDEIGHKEKIWSSIRFLVWSLKFEIEYPFSQKFGYLDIRNFC